MAIGTRGDVAIGTAGDGSTRASELSTSAGGVGVMGILAPAGFSGGDPDGCCLCLDPLGADSSALRLPCVSSNARKAMAWVSTKLASRV